MNGRSLYVGIDPGGSGGMATINAIGDPVAGKMPATERDIWEMIKGWSHCEPVAVIEKVGGYVGDGEGKGGGRANGSAMFKFGLSYGGLRMALIAAGIPFEEISPQTWQKAMKITPKAKDEGRTAWKNRLKAKAQQLHPQLTVTLATADAILIAEYCRRKTEGRL